MSADWVAALNFPKYYPRNNSTRRHDNCELKFACPHCGFRNKRKDHIYRHIRRKHPNEAVCYIDLSLYATALAPLALSDWWKVVAQARSLALRAHASLEGQKRGHPLQLASQDNDGLRHYCPNCNRSYKQLSHMRRHYRYECGIPQRFECPYCKYHYRQRTSVWSHIRTNHPNKEMYCVDIVTNGAMYRMYRVRGQGNEVMPVSNRHYCPNCHRSYKHRSHLLRHYNYECNPVQRFECPYCKHHFRQRTHVWSHIRTNHPNREFFCIDIATQTKLSRRNPGNETNMGEYVVFCQDGINQTCEMFQCPNCNNVYKWKKSLVMHLRYQCRKPPRFICLHCGARKYQKIHIVKHIKSYHPNLPESFLDNSLLPSTDDEVCFASIVKKPYPCKKCGRKFALKGTRSRHLKYECGHEKRFQCPYCNHKKELNSRCVYGGEYEALQIEGNFENDVPRKKSYQCQKCGNGYTVWKSLIRHLKYECGLKPRFKCPYCNSRAKQKAHIKDHIRRKHKSKLVYVLDQPC
ncbi:zinc finger protein 425-like [Leptopilina heterotoma]|uniref:zinc finger protein 425-like n=1 Tax=Leptopilina heterotoma TaxID=63436 RepID=UPI001CA9C6CB|nr:zinc finger protein 425-like [Leptopilina heterotoma]